MQAKDARLSTRLPKKLRKAVKRKAKAEGRSVSWLVCEALHAYLAKSQ